MERHPDLRFEARRLREDLALAKPGDIYAATPGSRRKGRLSDQVTGFNWIVGPLCDCRLVTPKRIA